MAYAKYKVCLKSELDLFEAPYLQESVLKTEEIPYKPIASLDNLSVLEFVCGSQGDTYRDLSSIYLSLKCRIVKSDGSVYKADADKLGTVNNILHSLFRQCTIYLGNKAISQQDNNYAYRAYLESILNYGNDAITTHLEAPGFYLDTAGKLDDLDANEGLKKRQELFAKSSVVELIGKIHGDLFNQHKYLLNNVDMRIVLSLHKPEFYMMETAAAGSKMQILDATLYMNHLTINPSVLIAHEQALAKANAYYPYTRVEVKTYTVPSGTSSLSLDNLVLGQIPNFILFAMCNGASYTGTSKSNPFNLQHFNLSSFCLQINGQMMPLQPLTFDFKQKPPQSMRAYSNLFKSTNMTGFDRGNQITKKFFDNGCFLLAFDLTSDLSATTINCSNLLNQGTIRIEGRFAEALTQTITCIVYCEYDSILEIDRFRNVYVS